MILIPPPRDPLGVLTSTLPVVVQARHVRIDTDRIPSVAAELAGLRLETPTWQQSLHWSDGTWRTAAWVLVLDTLNFCFWSSDPAPHQRWRVTWQGEAYDGYWALVAALRRGVDEGLPLWDSNWLANLTVADVTDLLRPTDAATPVIPLLADRHANLRELGQMLEARGGGELAITDLITGAGGSAVILVREIVDNLSSFDDVAILRVPDEKTQAEVRFFKRAQILVADLHAAFDGRFLGAFEDLDQLTAFADYKVPQVLRRFGLLHYDPALSQAIATRTLIPPGSPAEMEIRAATIWGVELLHRTLNDMGSALRPFEIDWALWQLGQSLPPSTETYHRTATIYY